MKQHFGSSLVGFIVGLVVGLAVALGIAVYVTKVPIPFLNKGQNRSAVQDVEEAKKNKDWDPNAPLYGKNPVRPDAPSAAAPLIESSAAAAASAARSARAPASATPQSRTDTKNAPSGDPLGDLVRDRSAAGGLEPFTYYVQVGAFRTPEDAEAQRAKLSLLGLEAKVSEREQSGRTVYRVRVGPFDKKDDADKSKSKLDAASIETALVRVQR